MPETTGNPEDESSQKALPEKRESMSRHPLLLVLVPALATVVVAVIGLFAAGTQGVGPLAPAPGATVVVTTPVTVTVTNTSTVGPTDPSPSGSPQVWHASQDNAALVLASGGGIPLDSRDRGWKPDSYGTQNDLEFYAGVVQFIGKAKGGVATHDKYPDYDMCRYDATGATKTQISTSDLHESTAICITTDGGRTAEMRMHQVTFDQITFDVTVWDDA